MLEVKSQDRSTDTPNLYFRVLPVEEWERVRLFGPFLEAGKVLPDPSGSQIVVVEDRTSGEIKGCWMIRNMALLEGLFLAEDVRHSMSAAKLLLFGMMNHLGDMAVGQVMTLASTPGIELLAIKAGFIPLPGVPYLLNRGRE